MIWIIHISDCHSNVNVKYGNMIISLYVFAPGLAAMMVKAHVPTWGARVRHPDSGVPGIMFTVRKDNTRYMPIFLTCAWVGNLFRQLGWVIYGLRCSLILPSCTARSANFPTAQAETDRGRKSQNQSQLNHRPDAHPFTIRTGNTELCTVQVAFSCWEHFTKMHGQLSNESGGS